MKRVLVPAAAAVLMVAGCGPQAPVGAAAAPTKAPGEAGFETAPHILKVQALPGGGLILHGDAAARSPIRLASPDGRVFESQTDAKGVWIMRLPTVGAPGLFGLSSRAAGRAVQAEGYVALLPEPVPAVALLRGGAGAVRIADPRAGLRIEALDVDASGSAVVSGFAAPGAPLSAGMDGTAAGQGTADTDGAFSISLGQPLTGAVTVRAGSDAATVTVGGVRPVRPAAGPYAISRLPAAWRIDWMTPGGGLQATILFDPAGAGA